MADMIFQVEDKPRPVQLAFSVIQQILAIITATITVPLIVGLGECVSSAILGCGVGTLIYLLITKRKSPVILSSNFAFVGALIIAHTNSGFLGIALGGILAGLVYVILSILVKKLGTAWIDKVFPPVIIGPVVATIGLGLSASAIGNIITVENYHYVDEYGTIIHPYNLVGLMCGLITFFIIVICAVQNRNKKISFIPFLFGVMGGYIVALILTLIGNATGVTYIQIIDFSPITNLFKEVSIASFLSLPKMSLVAGIQEIVNKNATLTGMGVLEVALAFVPISLVSFTEHIADHKNLSSIIGRDLIGGEPGLSRTLMGDGLGSIAGTLFGVCPNTTYGEAIGCVAITKNASTMTTLVTAISCVALSFFSPLVAILQTIPTCVIGGMCLSLFGYIAVSGLKMLKNVDFDNMKNIFTVSVVLVAGIGSLSLRIPYKLGLLDGSDLLGVVEFVEVSSNAFALILGILTYSLAGLVEKYNIKEEQ